MPSLLCSLTVVALDALDIVVLLYAHLVGKNVTFLGVLVLLVACNNLIISMYCIITAIICAQFNNQYNYYDLGGVIYGSSQQ